MEEIIRERKIDLGLSPKRSQFIGRIPLTWAESSWRLSKAAVVLGMVLWYLAGVKRSKEIRMPYARMENVGLRKWTARRGLLELEDAGLVAVARQNGRSPLVTILEVD